MNQFLDASRSFLNDHRTTLVEKHEDFVLNVYICSRRGVGGNSDLLRSASVTSHLYLLGVISPHTETTPTSSVYV